MPKVLANKWKNLKPLNCSKGIVEDLVYWKMCINAYFKGFFIFQKHRFFVSINFALIFFGHLLE